MITKQEIIVINNHTLYLDLSHARYGLKAEELP
jgi:hypothetical protein